MTEALILLDVISVEQLRTHKGSGPLPDHYRSVLSRAMT
jgi:hypothetical protein